VNVDLAQHRVAGVNEAMRCLRRNDDDAARFHLALFISEGTLLVSRSPKWLPPCRECGGAKFDPI
jgi:hypothetical protein